MGKLYTLDNKLLCGSPEIRIGDNVFPVDDRQKTVKKALKIFNDRKAAGGNGAPDTEEFDKLDELFRIAFGENYKKVEEMELSFAAYSELAEMVLSAMTGEDPDEFENKKKQKGQSFRKSDGDVV